MPPPTSVEASVETCWGTGTAPVGRSSSPLSLVSHKGEEVGLLGPLGPLVRGMGGVGTGHGK